MLVSLFLSMFFLIDASDSAFSPEEREKAALFINTCFKALEDHQQQRIIKLEKKADLMRDVAREVLAASQIDYRKYAFLDDQINEYVLKIAKLNTYTRSLQRPKEKIAVWEPEREAQAQNIVRYIFNTEEWMHYKQNPSDVEIYEQLHKRIAFMTRLLVPEKNQRALVLGTHAYPAESDEGMSYAFDRTFLLTLYLLDQALQKEKNTASDCLK